MDPVTLSGAGLAIAKLTAFAVLVMAWRSSARAVREMEAEKAERSAAEERAVARVRAIAADAEAEPEPARQPETV